MTDVPELPEALRSFVDTFEGTSIDEVGMALDITGDAAYNCAFFLTEAALEIERLNREWAVSIAKNLRLSNQLREQAAVHRQREVLLDQAADAYAQMLINVRRLAAENDRLRAVSLPVEEQQ